MRLTIVLISLVGIMLFGCSESPEGSAPASIAEQSFAQSPKPQPMPAAPPSVAPAEPVVSEDYVDTLASASVEALDDTEEAMPEPEVTVQAGEDDLRDSKGDWSANATLAGVAAGKFNNPWQAKMERQKEQSEFLLPLSEKKQADESRVLALKAVVDRQREHLANRNEAEIRAALMGRKQAKDKADSLGRVQTDQAWLADHWLTSLSSLDNLTFQEAKGYWQNTYLPGDRRFRQLQFKLADKQQPDTDYAQQATVRPTGKCGLVTVPVSVQTLPAGGWAVFVAGWHQGQSAQSG